nr:MAG TPA: hypothetical protein [Caudoviricetes sp.]
MCYHQIVVAYFLYTKTLPYWESADYRTIFMMWYKNC